MKDTRASYATQSNNHNIIKMKNKPTKHPTICLNMIVKDEEHVITRCLESVKDVIDYWVISDTGSSDKTKQIIKDFFAKHKIPGELHEHEWKNFSHNRNLALDAAQKKSDYIFMMDADDELMHDDNFRFKQLTEGSYFINCILKGYTYARRHLIKSDMPWKWVGVIHEHLECRLPYSTPVYPTGHIIASTEGARGQNPDRFKVDIEILKSGLKDEPNNTRYQFYLAQSYRDDGDFENALKEYQNRVAMRGWEEEVYYALYEVGNAQARLGMKRSLVLESLLKAYYYRPSRLEALHKAVSICRMSGHYHLGYQLGISALNTPMTTDVLFIPKSTYEWEFKDEVSICASWIGRKNEAKKIINELLKLDSLPDNARERIKNNLSFC